MWLGSSGSGFLMRLQSSEGLPRAGGSCPADQLVSAVGRRVQFFSMWTFRRTAWVSSQHGSQLHPNHWLFRAGAMYLIWPNLGNHTLSLVPDSTGHRDQSWHCRRDCARIWAPGGRGHGNRLGGWLPHMGSPGLSESKRVPSWRVSQGCTPPTHTHTHSWVFHEATFPSSCGYSTPL